MHNLIEENIVLAKKSYPPAMIFPVTSSPLSSRPFMSFTHTSAYSKRHSAFPKSDLPLKSKKEGKQKWKWEHVKFLIGPVDLFSTVSHLFHFYTVLKIN